MHLCPTAELLVSESTIDAVTGGRVQQSGALCIQFFQLVYEFKSEVHSLLASIHEGAGVVECSDPSAAVGECYHLVCGGCM